MKRYRGIIPRRKLNPITAALGANVFNVIVILILHGIQSLLPGDTYNVAYGAVALAVIVVFWFWYSYRVFARSTEDNHKLYIKYLALTMLPMVIYTFIAAIVVVTTDSGASFMRMWNGLTFGVAPALFMYLPYGLIYHFLPDSVPLIAFFAISLIIMMVVQTIGYFVGKRKLTTDEAKERKRKALEDKLEAEEREKEAAPEQAPAYTADSVQPEATPAAEAQQTSVIRNRRPNAETKPAAKKKPAKVDRRDPLGDVESKPIVETEAFSPITDDMIEKVMREERKKQRAEAQQERKAQAEKTREEKAEKKSKKPDDGDDGPTWVNPSSRRKRRR